VPEYRRKHVASAVSVQISHREVLVDVGGRRFREHFDRPTVQGKARVQFVEDLEIGNGSHDRVVAFDNPDVEFAKRIVSGQRPIVDTADDSLDTFLVRLEDADGEVIDDDSFSRLEVFLEVG